METPKTPLPVTCQREKKIGKGAREQTEDFWDAEGSIKAKLAAAMPLSRTEDIPKSETNRNHGSALRICAFSSSFTRCLRKFCPAARILLDAIRPYPLEFHNPFQPVSCWQSFLWYLWVTYVSPSMNFYFYQSPKGTVPSGHWPQIKNRTSLFSMQCHGHATAMPLGFRTFPVWPSASPAWLRLFSSPQHPTLWKTAARCLVHICSGGLSYVSYPVPWKCEVWSCDTRDWCALMCLPSLLSSGALQPVSVPCDTSKCRIPKKQKHHRIISCIKKHGFPTQHGFPTLLLPSAGNHGVSHRTRGKPRATDIDRSGAFSAFFWASRRACSCSAFCCSRSNFSCALTVTVTGNTWLEKTHNIYI